jgi:hypothetical protein
MRNASLPEIVYRLDQVFTTQRMRSRVNAGKAPVMVPLPDDMKPFPLAMPSLVMKVNKEVVQDILGGKIFTLNGERDALDQFEAKWRETYSADIRTGPESPDLKIVWEPARMQHLTIIMVHAFRNRRSPGIDAVKSFVRQAIILWIRQNRFLKGPHYISPMECGLRIPVFFYALKVLDNLTTEERREILGAIYLHAWWVSRNLSLYSSLGNHTICECVGLVFAGAVFQWLEEGREWLESGIRLLKTEANRQILGDGGPIEQSLAYHRFVLDLYWLVVDFVETNKLHDCSDLRERLTLGEAFLSAFNDERGGMPSIGDSDDGHAIAPGVSPKRKTPGPDRDLLRTFAESGYTIIRAANGFCLTFDHGLLGMPPLYNHGHADALSLTLSIGGQKFLIDPGTYRYNGEPQWRNYFKGTRAHNTVTVDGQDQAEQETGFIWRRPYTTCIIRNERSGGRSLLIEAEHDGYKRLEQPVVHRRAVFQIDDFVFLVRDRFYGRGPHSYELNWHLHPHAGVKKEDRWWRVEHNDVVMFIRLIGGNDFDLVSGGMNPVKGWYSAQYGIRETCSVLARTVEGGPEETEFITVMCAGRLTEEEQIGAAMRRLRTDEHKLPSFRAAQASKNSRGGK